MQTGQNQAGSYLPNGAYLYTALVHLHRSSGHRLRNKTTAAFLGLPLVSGVPYLMERHVGYISRTYFASVVSPHELLRRHTLFGFIHLGLDEDEALYREDQLIHGMEKGRWRVLGLGTEVAQNLRWCKQCADEERDSYGVASWKTVHQLASVRICHIHGDPLFVRCKGCGITPGSLRNFRLPGDVCPGCKSSDFEAEHVVPRDAYQIFVRDIAAAFQNQDCVYRDGAWSSYVSRFVSSFSSKSDAENEVIGFLCQEWEVSTAEEIWASLQMPFPIRGGLFTKGGRSLCVRVLLSRAMRALRPSLPPDGDVLNACSIDSSDDSLFGSVVRQHAKSLGFGERITNALVSSSNIRKATAEAGLEYARTLYAWKKVLKSMKDALGEDAVRALLPEGRQVHLVAKVGRAQYLLDGYKSLLTAALARDPGITRVSLWREHYRAMRYVSRMDYEWLAKMVGGNMPSRRPDSQ